MSYGGNSTRVRSKSDRIDFLVGYINGVLADPSLLEESFQARRDFGPGSGYESRQDWLDTQLAYLKHIAGDTDMITVPPGFLAPVLPVTPASAFDAKPAPEVVRGFIMRAKFNGRCKLCEGAIVANTDWIDYVKGDGAYHPQGTLGCEKAPERPVIAAPEAPKVHVPTGNGYTADELPAGRYAVEEDGVLKFFKVDHGKAGSRWEGRTFLSIQASDDLYPVKDVKRRARIFAEIVKSPQAAFERYGRELGVCGICGRTLTDEESRARGIGPVCIEKMGW